MKNMGVTNMIDIKSLKPGHEKLGLMVWYRTGIGGEVIPGKIKSWNDKYIFVVFKCDNNWVEWMNYTGEACKPEDLVLYGSDPVEATPK